MLRKPTLLATAFAAMSTTAMAAPDAMTAEEARHLISRTGFGAAPHEINAMTGKSYADAVDDLLDGLATAPSTPMPSWVDDWDYPYAHIWTLDQTRIDLFYTNRWLELEDLSAWWFAEMAATPTPLTERLVLFWSDHFATSYGEHENSQWTARQNRLFRTHAAGNFADLAGGILRDPAMLTYLDNTENVKDAPNENLGREFLELFTLGEGRGYTQDDVRAAARMLTGTTVEDQGAPRVWLDPEQFDAGKKTIFGQTGRYDADDLVDLTLKHPDFGPYIVEKLWLTFVSDEIDEQEIARLTALWLANDLEMKPLLEALFLSDAFWDKANRGRLVKSPIELLVGSIRTFGLSIADGRELIWLAEELGQQPFMPPNVGGWPHGIGWINEATASARASALTYLTSEIEAAASADPSMRMDAAPVAEQVTAAPEDFRVGQIFTSYLEVRDPGHGYGGNFTLYDVGFAGQNWRSLSFWLEHNDAEDFTSLYLYTGDCTPACLTGLPSDDDPQWVQFEPWDGFTADNPDLTDADIALMQAIATHLPALMQQTENSKLYGPSADDPNRPIAETWMYVRAAQRFRADTTRQIGLHPGQLVTGFSNPNVLGLAGLSDAMRETSVQAAVEASYESRAVPVIPAVTYASGRDWLNALSGNGPESARAAKTVLALPRAAQGLRDEMYVSDPDALLRHLTLSPVYQVK